MILVIGGAGYVGSHAVKELIRQNYRVVVLDNLSSGHRNSVDHKAVFERGDVTNALDLDRVFSRYSIDGVMYFVNDGFHDQSFTHSLNQYASHVLAGLLLVEKMAEYHISNFVFSSTTDIHSIAGNGLVTELTPISGFRSRQHVTMERMLQRAYQSFGLRYSILRYHNAAGACETGEIGEDHVPEYHIIPQLLQHFLHGYELQVCDSYDTPDGTYIRDYVHVCDVARAHVLALESLLGERHTSSIYTIGREAGISVKELIHLCEQVTGKAANVKYTCAKQRAVEPAMIVSARHIRKELGWRPEYSLEDMIASAWKWHSAHPDGYRVVLGV